MYTGADLRMCQFLTTINDSHQFYMPCIHKEPSNFQIYQYIKAIGNNNNLDVPSDIMQIIMSHVCQMTTQEHEPCYEEVHCYKSMPDVIINFIEDSFIKKRSHTTIVNILKKALQVSDNSLGAIRNHFGGNIFHNLFVESYRSKNYGGISAFSTCREINESKNSLHWAKILCLLAEKQIWNLIVNEEHSQMAFWEICTGFNFPIFNEVLRTAPNKEAIWKVICMPIKPRRGGWRNYMLLNEIIANENTLRSIKRSPFNASVFIIAQLLNCAPNEQKAWGLINTPDLKDGKTALDVAMKEKTEKEKTEQFNLINAGLVHIDSNPYYTYVYNNFVNIVDLLESYRPRGQS